MEKKATVGFVEEYRLSPIAVVDVEVKDGHPSGARGQRFEGGNRDVVEVAEAHRPVAGGMMSRRTHQAEDRLTGPRGLRSAPSAAPTDARA